MIIEINIYLCFLTIFLFIGRETELELCTFDFEYEGSNILYKEVQSQLIRILLFKFLTRISTNINILKFYYTICVFFYKYSL